MSLLLTLIVGIHPLAPSNIPITVLDTHQIDFVSDMQDLCYCEEAGKLIVRSNSAGKLYILGGDYTPEDSVSLPSGIGGFGVCALYEPGGMRFYVHGGGDATIHWCDQGDSWSQFPAPVGSDGMGMDAMPYFGTGDFFYHGVSASPCMFYCWDIEDSTYTPYTVPDIPDDMSGFMVHEVMTTGGEYEPTALITTTRFGHGFYFYLYSGGSGYYLYGQEDCPVTVEESLGLAWNFSSCTVFWGWKGTDGKYYVSELMIPVFGGIEDETAGVTKRSPLSVSANPSAGTAVLELTLEQPGTVTLEVFDASGRLVRTLCSGQLIGAQASWSFDAPAGIYTARVAHPGGTAMERFTVMN